MHRPLIFCAALALLITACGLKGPLYLPDQQQAESIPAESESRKRTRPVAPAPQSQKEDRESDAATPEDEDPAQAIVPPGA